MKKILIAALVVATMAVAAESSAASKADDAIKQVLAQLDRCFAASDPTCLGKLFVEDATYAAPTGDAKILNGKAQILKVLAESMAALKKQSMKLTHSLENVRMIGEDHAVVDISIAVGSEKPAKDDAASASGDSYRAVAVMALTGGEWLCEDLRSYVIGHSPRAQKESEPPAKNEPVPPAEKDPVPTAKP